MRIYFDKTTKKVKENKPFYLFLFTKFLLRNDNPM